MEKYRIKITTSGVLGKTVEQELEASSFAKLLHLVAGNLPKGASGVEIEGITK